MSSEASWRAVTLDFDEETDSEIIYIIDNYEKFYRDPLHNGIYKKVNRDILERNWIDRSNLLFWWRKQYYYQNLIVEEPIYGSHQESYGQLLDCIETLKDNAPVTIADTYTYPYPNAPLVLQSPVTLMNLTTELTWVALTLSFDPDTTTEIIYIINDYEKFYRDPLRNGIYKRVDRELLERNWIDRSNLMFWWKRQYFSDGSTYDCPVMGSQKEATGNLISLINTLIDNIPVGMGGLYQYPYPPLPVIPPSSTTVTSVTTEMSWVALMLDFDSASDTETIFIINDYERFFDDPLHNGIFKVVSRELLEKNWIDRSDLMFWWKRQYLSDGSVVDAPIMGSHKEIYGKLITLSQTLKDSL